MNMRPKRCTVTTARRVNFTTACAQQLAGMGEGDAAPAQPDPCMVLHQAWSQVAPPAPVGIPQAVHVVPSMPLTPLPWAFAGRAPRAPATCQAADPAPCECSGKRRQWLRALLLGGVVFWLGRASMRR